MKSSRLRSVSLLSAQCLALVSLLSIGVNLAQARIPPPPSLVSTKSPTSQVLVNSKSHKTCQTQYGQVAPSFGKIPPSGGKLTLKDTKLDKGRLEEDWSTEDLLSPGVESEERQKKSEALRVRDP
ncbi:unnamed protein product [Dovyalis caffra]|uniref:Uncharacterized protein n=1 Tax=Dovyalis caffra TaxID=77055 RepID=A0AAV1QSX1_9ROSI|nr:unnamed protein product [Dovyalis caffra]